MVLQVLIDGLPLQNCACILINVRDTTLYRKTWKNVKLLKFKANYLWLTTEELERTDTRTIIYSGSEILGRGRRHDAVLYKHYGVLMRGIVHMIIQDTPGSVSTVKMKIPIKRRLWQSAPNDDNRRVVKEFSHKRYEHCISTHGHGDIELDVVLLWNIERKFIIKPDLHDIGIRHSAEMQISSISD